VVGALVLPCSSWINEMDNGFEVGKQRNGFKQELKSLDSRHKQTPAAQKQFTVSFAIAQSHRMLSHSQQNQRTLSLSHTHTHTCNTARSLSFYPSIFFCATSIRHLALYAQL
jgi:hypothetical protein